MYSFEFLKKKGIKGYIDLVNERREKKRYEIIKYGKQKV